jgi:hypothetical protein
MSKPKPQIVKNFYTKKCGKNLNVPKEICAVVEKLEKLEFIRHIRLGDLRNSCNDSGIRVMGYDEISRDYHINVSAGKHEQRIILNVQNPNPAYEGRIKECFI